MFCCDELPAKELSCEIGGGAGMLVEVEGFVGLVEDEFEEAFPDVLSGALADIDFIVRGFDYKVVEPALFFANALFFYGEFGCPAFLPGLACGFLRAVLAKWVAG